MNMTIPTKQYGRQAALFGLAAAGFYLLMIFGTLAHIETLSGLRPFDMRPGGYSAELANSLINDLGPSGRRYYLTRQIPLDLVYPYLMALTLVSLLKWLGSGGVSQNLVRIGIWFSIAAAIADYLENAGICFMILSWPAISANAVLAASVSSIVKSGLTTAAVSVVVLGVVFWRSEGYVITPNRCLLMVPFAFLNLTVATRSTIDGSTMHCLSRLQQPTGKTRNEGGARRNAAEVCLE